MTTRITTHPGEILLKDYMEPKGLTARDMAKILVISQRDTLEILRGERAINSEMAYRLARYFVTSTDMWLSLQATHDVSRFTAEHQSDVI